ncbi:hypothetical protein [Pseudoflavonifractor phocaeensis]|uniref:hypothetical protein n=1 Tax=Pseudoflavonifractor phocaeensis TaxID=1870988 RepID=UPI001F304E1E|nr:hypothetical protein [Pseudoflavonifractor phocaeensis]MCF2662812.1 hypothetical protein [Pseudoflavonifractor phocaeensis]
MDIVWLFSCPLDGDDYTRGKDELQVEISDFSYFMFFYKNAPVLPFLLQHLLRAG